jgi:hypothetical protein
LTADRVSLSTADTDATVSALAGANAVIDLEISGPDLEEAFLAITAGRTVVQHDSGRLDDEHDIQRGAR